MLDLAGFCLRSGASAPLKNGWGAGGVAGGTGNDAFCRIAGKGGGRITPALGWYSVFNEQDCSVDVSSLVGESSGGQVADSICPNSRGRVNSGAGLPSNAGEFGILA